MKNEKLENLVKTRQIKAEAPDPTEVQSFVRAAKAKIHDSKNLDLSLESRFELSYSAAHSLALAALRRLGYRSENRIIVFQCLPHTLSVDKIQTRILGDIHNRRNLAAYEGEFEVSEQMVESLIRIVDDLLARLELLG